MAPKKTTKYGFEIVGTVGDVNFPEYGGGEVYKLPAPSPFATRGLPANQRGEFMLEYVEPPEDNVDFDDPGARWAIYRVVLDKGLPDGSLKSVAKTVGQKPSEIKNAFESNDPNDRAWAYECWAATYGWDSFDDAPLVLDKSSVEDRYDTEIGSGEDEEDEEEEEEEEEFSDEEMAEGYVLSDGRNGGYDVKHEGKSIGHFVDKDEASHAINKHMKKANFFPNIYYVNDHGNVDLLDENGDILKSKV